MTASSIADTLTALTEQVRRIADAVQTAVSQGQAAFALAPPPVEDDGEYYQQLSAEQGQQVSHATATREERYRAEEAEAAIARVRAECEAIGTDTCNAVTRILAVLDQPTET